MKVINKINIGSVNIQVNVINVGGSTVQTEPYTNQPNTTVKFLDDYEPEKERVYSKGTNNQNERDISFEETLCALTLGLTKDQYECLHEGENGGQMAVISLLRSWAWEFETRYMGQQWGIDESTPDWYDAIDQFILDKFEDYPEHDDTNKVY